MLVIAGLALYGYGQNPNYLSAFNLANILALATALGFIALGQTIPLLLAEGHGRAVAFALAPGQAHDLPMAPGLLGCLPDVPGWVVGDRGLASDAFREVDLGQRSCNLRVVYIG